MDLTELSRAVDWVLLRFFLRWSSCGIIPGSASAESVMSIFFVLKKNEIPVITSCKTIRMNIYSACYEIFINLV